MQKTCNKPKALDKKLENSLQASSTPSKIDLSRLKIKADIAPRVSSNQLAQMQLSQNLPNSQAQLATQLPPQIYEIESSPDLDHLSSLNESLLKERNITQVDAEDLSYKEQDGSSFSTGNGIAGGTPAITLPVSSSLPKISLPAPEDPRVRQQTQLSNQPKLPQLHVESEKEGQLDDVLQIEPTVYIDPISNQGYFQVDITLDARSSRLISRPKEILFLLDTSSSIRYDQFKSFVYSIRQGILALNHQDKFNIVTFSTKDTRCFTQYVHANQANMEQAFDFLDNIQRGGKTDIYASIYKYVREKNSSLPRIIYLASDGNVTQRGSYQGVEVISRLTAFNENKKTAIFAISNGDEVNPFLLDLLTLRNRGYSLRQEDASKSTDFFENFIKTYSDTVVNNLSYHFSSNINTENIFPRKLPDLYRGGTVTIYGRFDPQIQQSTLVQVRGTGAKGNEEITFKIHFNKAKKGSPMLAQSWAHRKILFLLGKLTDNTNNSAVRKQLKGLMNKYKIPIPYQI